MPGAKRVLMLQGPASRFWARLADALEREGHHVTAVHLCLPDILYWRRGSGRSYRGRLSDFEGWIEALMAREGITDVLYYADRLPYHIAAARAAGRLSLRAWAFENGYLRPDWLTMEPVAMGRFSRFERDPVAIRARAEGLAEPDMTPLYPHSFMQGALSEVPYFLLQTLGRPLFPFYVTDKRYPPVLDYASWAVRVTRQALERREGRRIKRACYGRRWPYFLLALQLQSDYQIRASSDYAHLSEMLEEVIGSFAEDAPPETRLVVKLHPEDNGAINWFAIARDFARARGIAERVLVLDGGNLRHLMAGAAGLVTVNSTAGLHALQAGCPVKVLGDAIYDMPGLTDPQPLGDFWSAPAGPDPSFVRAFIKVIAAEIQLRGGFYTRPGQEAAAAEIARRLTLAERYWRLAPGARAAE